MKISSIMVKIKFFTHSFSLLILSISLYAIKKKRNGKKKLKKKIKLGNP